MINNNNLSTFDQEDLSFFWIIILFYIGDTFLNDFNSSTTVLKNDPVSKLFLGYWILSQTFDVKI